MTSFTSFPFFNFSPSHFFLKQFLMITAKAIKVLLLGLVVLFGLTYSYFNYANPPITPRKISIGIVLPMDHVALREIMAGFKEKLKDSPHAITFKVQNAQGDMNVQRSIIQQFVRQEVDIIVPIGTNATQMTVSMVKKQPIISLAANFAIEAREKLKLDNITGVLDEIGPEKPLEFLKAFNPNIKKVTLVYSNSEKIFPEVREAEVYAKKVGIKLQLLMIQSLSELYTISRLIDQDTDAVFTLKDHIVVSGIKTLMKQASSLKIPVLTSDEGSVLEGATFALGVRERSIGEAGGMLANKILSGEKAMDLPVHRIKNLVIFYNPTSFEEYTNFQKVDSTDQNSNKQNMNKNINIEYLKSKAMDFGYQLQKTDTPS